MSKSDATLDIKKKVNLMTFAMVTMYGLLDGMSKKKEYHIGDVNTTVIDAFEATQCAISMGYLKDISFEGEYKTFERFSAALNDAYSQNDPLAFIVDKAYKDCARILNSANNRVGTITSLGLDNKDSIEFIDAVNNLMGMMIFALSFKDSNVYVQEMVEDTTKPKKAKPRPKKGSQVYHKVEIEPVATKMVYTKMKSANDLVKYSAIRRLLVLQAVEENL